MLSQIRTRASHPEVSDITSQRWGKSKGTEFLGQTHVQSQKKEDWLKEKIDLSESRSTFIQMMINSCKAGII